MFEERQRFRQKWLWALLGGVFLSTTGLFAWGLYVQIIQGRPWGNHPLSNGVLVGLAVAVIGIDALLFALFAGMRLLVRVGSDELTVRLAPFPTRRIAFRDLRSFHARPVSPLREYGGLGIRGARRNRAYLVSGGEGVQLVLEGGDRVFIGSARAKELEDAIARASGKVPGQP